MKRRVAHVIVVLFVGLAASTHGRDFTNALGILNLDANGGINPATGQPWGPLDTYRFVFCSSVGIKAESSDIDTYNAFVQGLADASPLGIGTNEGVTWKAIASTSTVAAKDNADLDPTGTGVSIFLLDGNTCVADDYVDLYGFDTMNSAINKSETLGSPLKQGTYWNVWTGTKNDGTIAGSDELAAVDGGSRVGIVSNNDRHWIDRFGDQSQGNEAPMYAISQPLSMRINPAGVVFAIY